VAGETDPGGPSDAKGGRGGSKGEEKLTKLKNCVLRERRKKTDKVQYYTLRLRILKSLNSRKAKIKRDVKRAP